MKHGYARTSTDDQNQDFRVRFFDETGAFWDAKPDLFLDDANLLFA